eukprot:scaffold235896_cov31-Tisochrysis_lutea.AAC.1
MADALKLPLVFPFPSSTHPDGCATSAVPLTRYGETHRATRGIGCGGRRGNVHRLQEQDGPRALRGASCPLVDLPFCARPSALRGSASHPHGGGSRYDMMTMRRTPRPHPTSSTFAPPCSLFCAVACRSRIHGEKSIHLPPPNMWGSAQSPPTQKVRKSIQCSIPAIPKGEAAVQAPATRQSASPS